jgi:hypothetical protein
VQFKRFRMRSVGGRRAAATVLTLGVAVAAALVGPAAPAHAVAAPFVVSATSDYNTNSPKTVRAVCPAGTKVYGAHAEVVTGNGNVVLTNVSPSSDLQAARAKAYAVAGYANNWRVIAIAVCGSPVANLQLVTAISVDRDSTAFKSAEAKCPDGTRLYGTGGEISGGGSGVLFDTVGLPDSGLTKATAFAHENGVYTPEWVVFAFAICGSPATTMQLVRGTSGFDSSPVKSATLACPSGTHVHGLGGQIVGAGNNLVINGFSDPAAALTFARIEAWESGAFAGNWGVNLLAICSS